MQTGGPAGGWQYDQTRWTNAEYAPPPPPPPPSKRRPLLIIGIIAAIVVVAGAAAYLFASSRGGSSNPAQWDAQVAPIATKVAALRGLTFKHPVKVVYQTDAEFEKRFTSTTKLTKQDQARLDQSTALFRALGVVGPGVDIRKAVTTSSSAAVIGYYDFASKQIFVRGQRALDAYTTVTLAHELTHVLQDQNFNISKRQTELDKSTTASGDAYRAVVEGDAVSIQNKYLKAQSKAFRDTYAQQSKSFASKADARTKDVPAAVSAAMEAPYIFGPNVISVLTAGDNPDGVNHVLSTGEPTESIYFDPTTADTKAALIPVPKVRTGEKLSTVDKDTVFDRFTMLLMLASRLDPATALAATNSYYSGSSIEYTRGNTVCFRASIEAPNEAGGRAIGAAVKRWAGLVGDAQVESTGTTVTFHSCDAGARTRTPSDKAITGAVQLAAARDEFIAGALQGGAEQSLARCVARLYMGSPGIVSAVINNESPDVAGLRETASAAASTCRADPKAGLPR